MKLIVCIAVASLLTAITAQPVMARCGLTRNGAMINVRLHIVDPEGLPVPQARLWGGLQTGDGLDDFVPIEGLSDSNGDFVIKGKCTNRLRCRIRKEGYYQSDFLLSFPVKDVDAPVIDGKWQPFGEMHNVVLKPIRKPGACCIFPESLRNCRIPKFGEWIGFDFERSEWVHPYGRGEHSDVLLRFSSTRNGIQDYRYAMDVSFTNNPYAGAYFLKEDNTSRLTTEYTADTNATYHAEFTYVKEQTPGHKRHWDFLDSSSYLVFRTRTRVDEDGNLIGAHYGKIIGRWLSERDFMILSDGCFNPVENDNNIEDGNCLRDVIRNMGKNQ